MYHMQSLWKMKKCNYVHPSIQICDVCQGKGYVETLQEGDIYERNELKCDICTQCMGSGRIVVSSVTTTTITAYTPEYKYNSICDNE